MSDWKSFTPLWVGVTTKKRTFLQWLLRRKPEVIKHAPKVAQYRHRGKAVEFEIKFEAD